MIYDVIVVGGGPAGMTAAIEIKKAAPEAKILLLDRNKKVGKKLYATGNGKCNIANTELNLSSYHSENEFFPYQIVGVESYRDVTGFFDELGVVITDDEGYLYPMSLQASTVVWALTDRLRIHNVALHMSEEVISVKQNEHSYSVITDKDTYETYSVIMAPGSAAAPKLGGTDRVYNILSKLGVPVITPHPALCKLKSKCDISLLTGVRVRACAVLECNGEKYDREQGEIQFNNNYLSGIAIFNLSIQCAKLIYDGCRPVIELEYVPHMSEEKLHTYMTEFIAHNAGRRPEAMLNGLVNEKIGAYILQICNVNCTKVSDVSERQITEIEKQLKHMRFEITDTAGYEECQAASGGIDTRCIRPDTMEIEGMPGLYIAGEYMDVVGKCGGYNIMWAVLSGMRAGFAAGKRIQDDQNK